MTSYDIRQYNRIEYSIIWYDIIENHIYDDDNDDNNDDDDDDNKKKKKKMG